jgi:aminoglycoside/choline kinase family phosphotransferase
LSVSDRYPTTVEDIDAAWLTAAMAERNPGVVVESVEVRSRQDMTNSHALITLTYADPDLAATSGAPATAFCKMAPVDGRREAIIATRMGPMEARFYRELAPLLDLRVPEAHVAADDDDSGLFVLVLEDLVDAGCLVSDGTWGIPADAVAGALEELAVMHARFADDAVRQVEAGWVPVRGPGGDMGKVMLRYGIEHHRDRLSGAFVDVASIYCERTTELHDLWHEGPRTVIHGDTHLGNLFLDDGRVGFLDWGIINAGSCMRDASYLLTMAMDIEERRANQIDLLHLYVEALAAAGGPEISVNEAWAMHRVQAGYNVPASCQVVTFEESRTPERSVFADAFLARAEASLDDLEVVVALAARGLDADPSIFAS